MGSYEAVKVQLGPTPRQERLMASHAGAARFAYNAGLAHVKEALENGETPKWSHYDLRRWWNANKDELAVNRDTGVVWWSQNSKESYSMGLRSLAQGLSNWSRSRKGQRKGKRVGFPKFKSKNTTMRFAYSTAFTAPTENDPYGLKLPRIGRVHCMENVYRRVAGARLIRITVSRRAGRWYASLTVEREPTATSLPKCGAVGALSRKVKGSVRREKAKKRVARLLHARVADVRADAIHKATAMIVNTYGTVCVEDLNVAGMVKNHHLARSLSDAALGEFRRQLEYKTARSGAVLRVVDRWFPSSKTCSNCGVVKAKLSLSERVFHCDDCGASMDRDLNAAINIQVAGSAPETLNARGGDVRRTGLVSGDADPCEARTKRARKSAVRLGVGIGNEAIQPGVN